MNPGSAAGDARRSDSPRCRTYLAERVTGNIRQRSPNEARNPGIRTSVDQESASGAGDTLRNASTLPESVCTNTPVSVTTAAFVMRSPSVF